jgi:hypothetical protein
MEKNKDIERAAALALLDRGIAFRIPAPWWMRLVGRKHYKIKVKRLRLGTLLHLSAIANFGLEPFEAGKERTDVITEMEAKPISVPMRVIVNQVKPLTLAVAACLLNSEIKIRLLAKPLARHLRRHCTPDQLQELIMWLFVYGRAESFTNTTKFVERMRMTMPMNLGQD